MATAQDVWNEIDRRIGLALDEALALLGVENIPQGGAGGPGSAGGLPVHGNAHHMPPMALASDLLALEFIDLADVPSSYTGQVLKYPRVTAGENGLEFHAITASDVGADPAGTAAGLIADLLAEPDPFPQYLTEAEADLLYADIIHTHSAADVVSGTLASARGGTGVSNAGTITVPSNVSITGGGVIALDGFTVTVPATGTVPLGTGAANQVALWSGANTLVGDAGFTYNATTDVFAVTGTSTFTATTASTYPLYIVSDQPVAATDGSAFGVAVYSDIIAGRFFFGKARGTLASPTIVTVASPRLATLDFRGYDGNTFETSSSIQAEVDGTPGDGFVPGRIKFLTADSAGALVEAGRFTSNQALWINITTGGLATVGAVDVDGEIRSNRTTGGLVTIWRRDTGVTTGESIGQLSWGSSDSSLTANIYGYIEVQAAGNSVDAARAKMLFAVTPNVTDSAPVVRLTIEEDGRIHGSALHNNTGAVTGTTNQYLASGTYTPALTNTTNVAASTAYQCQWMRVGNVVTVSGKVDVDPTGAGNTVLGIALPIASNIGAAEDCTGAAFATGIAGQGAAIVGNAANDRANMQWVAVDVTNQAMAFIFTYEVI